MINDNSRNLPSEEFRVLLDLCMCSDPWPLVDDPGSKEIMEHCLNALAKQYEFKDWISAYHGLSTGGARQAQEGEPPETPEAAS